jgi:Ser/Thr protein kinase RdoA (MazF antagonist)
MDETEVVKQYVVSKYKLDGTYNIELLADNCNTVFLVTNGLNEYIFRIYAFEKRVEVIESEIELLSFLSCYGLSTELPISNCKGLYYDTIVLNNSIRGCAMYKALSGIIYDEMLTKEQSKKLGILAGRLHNIFDLYTGHNFFKSFGYEELVMMPWRTIKPYIHHNKELFEFYEAVIMGSETRLRNNEGLLSYGICHGDLHAGNVIFNQNNEPGIFDFDLGCNGWRLYDLATFIWSIVPREDYSNENIELVNICIQSFIEGYREQRALSKEEFGLIFNMVLLRHIWRQAERIDFENANGEWISEQHFIVQMNRMKKWAEIYGIDLRVN